MGMGYHRRSRRVNKIEIKQKSPYLTVDRNIMIVLGFVYAQSGYTFFMCRYTVL